MRLSYAIVFVSDMARSVAFYRDVFGLPVKFESPHWTEFATEGATLALHAAKVEAAGSSESAGSCRPGISVPALDAFYRRMIEKNVICLELPKVVFEARIAQYQDPDGLVISVSHERAKLP